MNKIKNLMEFSANKNAIIAKFNKKGLASWETEWRRILKSDKDTFNPKDIKYTYINIYSFLV